MDLVANFPELAGPPAGLRELLAFVGLQPSPETRNTNNQIKQLFSDISRVTDDLLVQTIAKRTAEEFQDVRRMVLPNYVRTVRAASDLTEVVVADVLRDRLTEDAFSAINADIENQGLARFGPKVKGQAAFTVWNLQRISSVLKRMSAYDDELPEEFIEQDKELARKFSAHLWWAQFHLDCVLAAIRLDRPLYPGTVDEICDGMRAAVNAYAIAREGLELRQPRSEEATVELGEWTEEDQLLLDSAMADLDREPVTDAH